MDTYNLILIEISAFICVYLRLKIQKLHISTVLTPQLPYHFPIYGHRLLSADASESSLRMIWYYDILNYLDPVYRNHHDWLHFASLTSSRCKVIRNMGWNYFNINRRWTQINADRGYYGFQFRLSSRNFALWEVDTIFLRLRI